METKDQYPYIWAWGKLLGSLEYYIKDQIELAIWEKAPLKAIYRRQDGTWATAEGLSPLTRKSMEQYLPESVL